MEYITYLKFNWHSKLIGFEENGWLGMKYKALEHLKLTYLKFNWHSNLNSLKCWAQSMPNQASNAVGLA
jgi:hypothetical protein